jgi:SAM-dependent methyltransferase
MKADEVQRVALVESREDFLKELCSAHERTAHIGCTDTPYTVERLQRGELLHSMLVEYGEVVGFDVDETGIDLLREHFPDRQFVYGDISRDVPKQHARAYDLVVAGEVLEHLANPGLFLAGCNTLLRDGGRLCVTVPNALSPKIGLRSIIGRERVHPDHHVYYGPRTLRRTLRSAEFGAETLVTYFARAGGLGQLVNGALRLAHRGFTGPIGDGLICVATRL